MNKMYQKFVNKLNHYTWFRFVSDLCNRFEEDDCREKAASLTYTTALSIVPVLTVFIVILSSIPSLNAAQDKILNWFYSNLLPQTSLKISTYFNDFAEKSTNLTLIGVVFLFLTTLMLLAKIENVFNAIWHVPVKGKGITNFSLADVSRYWLMITLVPIMLSLSFIFSSTLSSLNFLNKEFAGYAIDWGIWLEFFSVCITIVGITCLYWFVPICKVPLKYASIAGICIGITFEVIKSLFGLIIVNFTSYQLIYGAFAALPLLMLWIYLSWCIILFGVEISCLLNTFNSQENHTSQHQFIIAIKVLATLYHAQSNGQTISTKMLLNTVDLDDLMQWHAIKKELVKTGLITQDIDQDWLLKTNLDYIKLSEMAEIFNMLTIYDTGIDSTHISPLLLHLNTQEANTVCYTVHWQELLDTIQAVNTSAKNSLEKPLSNFLTPTT